MRRNTGVGRQLRQHSPSTDAGFTSKASG